MHPLAREAYFLETDPNINHYCLLPTPMHIAHSHDMHIAHPPLQCTLTIWPTHKHSGHQALLRWVNQPTWLLALIRMWPCTGESFDRWAGFSMLRLASTFSPKMDLAYRLAAINPQSPFNAWNREIFVLYVFNQPIKGISHSAIKTCAGIIS